MKVTRIYMACALVCVSLFSGCTKEETVKQEITKNEVVSYENQIMFSQTTFMNYFQENYGEYNELAKSIFDAINKKESKVFTQEFPSQSDAEDFIYRFNTEMFLTLDYVQNNGIQLDSFENKVATISIVPETFDNMNTYQQFVDLAKSLISDDDLKDVAVQKFNNWFVENIEYDTSSANKSTDIFTGKSQAEGISYAMKILCNICGIGCDVVDGSVNGVPSSWNKIYLEDEACYLDTTQNVYLNTEDAYSLSNELWSDHVEY